MIEEILPDSKFNIQKMSEDFFVYGYYCFFDSNLMSLVKKNNWSRDPDSINFFVLEDSNACDIAKTIIHNYICNLFKLSVRYTVVFSGIDKTSDEWHTDNLENMFCQSLCYQEDLYEYDGGAIRLKCLDGVERFLYPKNGCVLIINHLASVEHKVDKIISNKKRIVINTLFDIED